MVRNEQESDAERVRKQSELARLGFVPPYRFRATDDIGELHQRFAEVPPGVATETVVTVHGRVIGQRDHGGLVFADLWDSRGRKIQAYFQGNSEADKRNLEAARLLDEGDWVGTRGRVVKTRKGELSILVDELTLLAKCLRPVPSRRNGLRVGERRRRPWVNLRFDERSRHLFWARAESKRAIRELMDRRGFVEIDTPILSPNYGGASAEPFVTFCNALGEELYLSISPELFLKEAIIGGFQKVYTIARNFRNEDIDSTHNPEFEMIELYSVGDDYNDMMNLVEELFTFVANRVLGTNRISYQGVEIDLTPPWPRASMEELVLSYYGLRDADLDELLVLLEKERLDPSQATSRAMAIYLLFDNKVQRTLVSPTFVKDYPEEVSPLTRVHRCKPGWVERFELFILGVEYANAYSELQDPEEQERRLRLQDEQRRRGRGTETHPLNEEFIDAMYWGFPTTGGLGVGIDRLVMMLSDSASIRDVIFAPLHRPVSRAQVGRYLLSYTF